MIYFFIFFLGATVGSFLSSVLYRLPRGRDFIFGRSICPHCQKKLTPLQLIPIFSFLFQKGKCAFCKKPISWHYPAIEILSGLLFVFIFWHFSSSLDFWTGAKIILFWAIGAILLLSAFYDLFYYEIPNGFIILLFVFGLLYLLGQKISAENFNLLSHFWGFLVGGGLLFPLFYFSQERLMGGGDVKLMAGLGLILGYPLVLADLFLAFVMGGIFASFLLILKIKKLKDPLPFGPFLILGFFLAFFFSNFILNFYTGWA